MPISKQICVLFFSNSPLIDFYSYQFKCVMPTTLPGVYFRQSVSIVYPVKKMQTCNFKNSIYFHHTRQGVNFQILNC